MCAYRQDFIPQQVWEPLLDRYHVGTVSDSGAQFDHAKSVHADVSKVLDYFNLPGAVTKWLPALQSLNLSQWKLLSFAHNCRTMEQVQAAANAVFAYKPAREPQEPLYMATFVFCVDNKPEEGTSISKLRAHVLQRVPKGTSSIIGRDPRGKLAGKPHTPMQTAIAVPLNEDGSNAGDAIPWSRLSLTGGNTVSARDEDFGKPLLGAVQAHLKGTRIDLLHRNIGDVNLWVLVW